MQYVYYPYRCEDKCWSVKFPTVLVVVKYFVLQIPVFLMTGAMYFRVILVLRGGAKNNARKRNLSIAFCILWLAWVLFSLPYAVYEAYKAFLVSPGEIDGMFELHRTLYLNYCGRFLL